MIVQTILIGLAYAFEVGVLVWFGIQINRLDK